MFLTITLVIAGAAAGWFGRNFHLSRIKKKPITPEQARLPPPEGIKRINYLISWLNKNLALESDNKFTAHFNGKEDTDKIINEVIKRFEKAGWKITKEKKNSKIITFSEEPGIRVDVSKENDDKDLEEGMKEVEKLLRHEK